MMENVRNAGEFNPYYPKGIADDVNFPKDLGLALLKLFDEYRKKNEVM